MIISGSVIAGVGLTFVIKSAKTPKDSTPKIEIKPWNPLGDKELREHSLHP